MAWKLRSQSLPMKISARKSTITPKLIASFNPVFFCIGSIQNFLFLGLLVANHRNDGGFNNFQPKIVGRNTKMKSVVFHGNNRSTDTSAGRHLIPGFEIVDHLLPALLPPLLRENKENIKNADHQNHHDQR